MATFGIASQVLQIVPAPNKAETPGSTRESDQDFLNHLERATERRDDARDMAAARAEARETSRASDDDAPPRGETISEAAPNQEKPKDRAPADAVNGVKNDGAASGDEVAHDTARADSDTKQTEGQEKPAETANASPNEETTETETSATTATKTADESSGTAAQVVVRTVAPTDGEGADAKSAASADGEDVAATLNANGTSSGADEATVQVAAVTGNAGEAGEGDAPRLTPTAAQPAKQAVDIGTPEAQDALLEPVLATYTADELDAGVGDDAPLVLGGAPTPVEVLASAAAGAMSGPKVVLTPKSGGDIKRPLNSGTVQVASAEDRASGAAAGSSQSKGFTPTATPGQQQAAPQTGQPGQPGQTGLPNALAAVTDNQGDDSNSALKLAALTSNTQSSPNAQVGAQRTGPALPAGAPQPQAVAPGVANAQALQNASNQASPLRAVLPPPPPPNPAAFQVAIHVARAIDDGLDQIKIRLHPANLGRVEVKLEVAQDGRVAATIIADKADTLDMLQKDSRALEKALEEAGLRTDSESLNFGLRGEQDQTESGKSDEGHQNASGQDDNGSDDLDVLGVIPPSRPLTAPTGVLDIFV